MKSGVFLIMVWLTGCGGLSGSDPEGASAKLVEPNDILTFTHIGLGSGKIHVTTMTRAERDAEVATSRLGLNSGNAGVGRLERGLTVQRGGCNPGDVNINDATTGLGSYTICLYEDGSSPGSADLCTIGYGGGGNWCGRGGPTFSRALYLANGGFNSGDIWDDANACGGNGAFGGANPAFISMTSAQQSQIPCYWNTLLIN